MCARHTHTLIKIFGMMMTDGIGMGRRQVTGNLKNGSQDVASLPVDIAPIFGVGFVHLIDRRGAGRDEKESAREREQGGSSYELTCFPSTSMSAT